MSTTLETVSLVAQTTTGEIRLLPMGTVLVGDTEDGVVVLLKTERPRVVALSILDETAFAAVWHLVTRWPAAVGYAELLGVFENERVSVAVVDAAIASHRLEELVKDLERALDVSRAQLAVVGLDIVSVEGFGYKIGKRETGE
jgi:hypothetical protein